MRPITRSADDLTRVVSGPFDRRIGGVDAPTGTVPGMTTDATGATEAIMSLRRGGKAVILMTYRGDW